MYPFIETIRVKDGELMNLLYHQKRLEITLEFLGGCQWTCDLNEVLKGRPMVEGVFKARVVYDAGGIREVEFLPYQVRTIKSLALVVSDDIDYSYKSTDRRSLVELTKQKGETDEIVIVKNGLLTDTSYSNIALFDGKQWYTPRLPLLKGTMRQSLLDEGVLVEKDILAEEFGNYEKMALINAMMPLGACEISFPLVTIKALQSKGKDK